MDSCSACWPNVLRDGWCFLSYFWEFHCIWLHSQHLFDSNVATHWVFVFSLSWCVFLIVLRVKDGHRNSLQYCFFFPWRSYFVTSKVTIAEPITLDFIDTPGIYFCLIGFRLQPDIRGHPSQPYILLRYIEELICSPPPRQYWPKLMPEWIERCFLLNSSETLFMLLFNDTHYFLKHFVGNSCVGLGCIISSSTLFHPWMQCMCITDDTCNLFCPCKKAVSLILVHSHL